MGCSQSLFQNARNIEVKDTQINAIANSNVTIVQNTANNDAVLTTLWPHVAAGAIFDSGARYAAGKCHPGTRTKIIARIVDWINEPHPTTFILWLYGAAGAGKSAIAHTICELMNQSHPSSYGGCFFFEFGPTDRGNSLKLFTTLAYQLAIQSPSIRSEINTILSRDPSLPTKSMEIQLHSLIVQPLLRCKNHQSQSYVLIIDGLDECADDEGMDIQRNIVALIAKSIVDYNLPLRFIIASRPEYWIRDAFDTEPLHSLTEHLSLRDDKDADEDIRAYLTSEFEKIRTENKQIMGSVVPPWPPTEVVKRFVEEASGQFIYAATILRFVGKFSRFSNPQMQLEIIISSGPYRAPAFSELDRLYATIVSAYPRWETMKRVLAGILLGANTTILNKVLGLDSDELVLVLNALSSLIDIQKFEPLSEESEPGVPLELLESIFGGLEEADKISFCHRSFWEFLQDSDRSGNFYIDLDLDAVPNDILRQVFNIIYQNIDEKYEMDPSVSWKINPASYHLMIREVTYYSAPHSEIGTLLELVAGMTHKLEPLLEPSGSAWTHMHSLFFFTRDMYDLYLGLRPVFKGNINRLHEDEEGPRILEFNSASSHLRNVILQACKTAFLGLSSCANFEVTPAAVYLAEYSLSSTTELPIHQLCTIAGVTDGISALRQYSYLLPLSYIFSEERYGALSEELSVNKEDYSDKTPENLIWPASWPLPWPEGAFHPLYWNVKEPSWRMEGAWRNLRISMARTSLEEILHSKNKLIFSLSAMKDQFITVARFFRSSISNVSDPECFQNASHIAILKLMANTDAWISLCKKLTFKSNSEFFIVSALCWFDRQLKNSNTRTLLNRHDRTLEQNITITMKAIFEEAFVQNLAKSHQEGLSGSIFAWCREFELGTSPLIVIKFKSLPKGFDVEDASYSTPSWDPEAWVPFHREVFGNTSTSTRASIIDPPQWYRPFVSRVLRDLIESLYAQIGSPGEVEFLDSRFESLYPYLTQCLPYAQPTADNLDALRAIVYLRPLMAVPWNPPEGFWSALVEFLEKYDRSILSCEEFDLFVKWINSTDHADIKTYV